MDMDVAALTRVIPSLFTMAVLTLAMLTLLMIAMLTLGILTLPRTHGRTVTQVDLARPNLTLFANPNPNFRWISRAPRTWGEAPR